MTKIEKAIRWMEDIAKDDSHGYDQNFRWGEKGDYDCSAAVITAWDNAGVPVKKAGATYTGNLRKAFISSGFIDVTNKVNRNNGYAMERGDVLLAEGKHTAMYCGDNKEVEASINEKGTATNGKPGDQTKKEFLIRKYRNYPWTHVLRYKEPTSTDKKIQNPDKKATKLVRLKVATNKCGLRIRSGAGTGASIIMVMPKGSIVEWNGTKKVVNGEDWYRITYLGHTGYALAKWLKRI